jgi:leucyl-tRNA synthetase
MNDINLREIEIKWQKYWQENNCHDTNLSNPKNKYYNLSMFSYPSGDKLHIGHWFNYGPADTFARFKKMQGYDVFQPQGFDAFGLPAENYAIKHGVHPAVSTKANVKKMKEQLLRIGAMYDWNNEVNTSSPDYYKWTQWLFLKLFEMGLAYQKVSPVNWCPSCATVLANEQVKEGTCDRCHSEVTKRSLKQWFFKITDYAEELLSQLDNLNWPAKTIHMQRNWIGKSIGAKIIFDIQDFDETIEVFTTRSDTIYGATYMVLAPEHKLVDIIGSDDCKENIRKYKLSTKKMSEIDRSSADREKTGVFTGAYAVNPFTHEKIQIWISDYVLASYGTGAIMAVPSGDERDFQFAQKYNLPIIEVVSPDGKAHGADQCFSDYGVSLNSGEYSGRPSNEVITSINEELERRGIGGAKVQFKLHDWLISRQRYWGAPIPVIHCDDCGAVPVSFDELPVLLPEDIKLSETYGEDLSPLATNDDFINAPCPKCGKAAHRDADTMDTFVCSSWYYLRYPNASYEGGPFESNMMKWLPVDQYIGGAEHATMHLLYARFVTKVLRDAGYLLFGEPFTNLFHQGTITRDGAKMSKSKGNTVSPDDYVDKHGADIFRAYLMFMGPYEDGGDWTDTGIVGIERFYYKGLKLIRKSVGGELNQKDKYIIHYTIKSVTHDLENKKFNTAISRLMEYVNHFLGSEVIAPEVKNTFVLLLAPFMPHIAEEMWQILGKSPTVFNTDWPVFDEALTKVSTCKIALQVNGKLRGTIEVDAGISNDDLLNESRNVDNIKIYVDGKTIIKEIVVPKRLVNFVVR